MKTLYTSLIATSNNQDHTVMERFHSIQNTYYNLWVLVSAFHSTCNNFKPLYAI